MKKTFTALLLYYYLLSISLVRCDGRAEDEYVESFRKTIENVQEKFTNITNQTILTEWSMSPIGYKFNCPHFERPGPATTVHELTPYDIAVVGALGDSITAAFGAKSRTLLDLMNEYRGVSWSIGGDEDLNTVTTLPNIIREYNPNLKGFSIGKGSDTSEGSRLNVAISGAIAEGMPSQARTLIEKIRSDPDIDFQNDWKLVTLWIGGNNLCRYCKDEEKHSPENYVKYIKEALDILYEELPRTFVNLVQIIDVTRLKPVIESGFTCELLAGTACSCAKDGEGSRTSIASTEYQNKLSELIATGMYTKNDFTVVIQPFFMGVQVPYDENDQVDKTYFAPDCFHFSTKGHKEGAVALWNNMFEAVGSKTTGWTIGGPIKCPDENNPYLKTKENSQQAMVNAYVTENNAGTTNAHVTIETGSIIGVSIFVVFIIIVAFLTAAIKWHQKNVSKDSEHIALISNKL